MTINTLKSSWKSQTMYPEANENGCINICEFLAIIIYISNFEDYELYLNKSSDLVFPFSWHQLSLCFPHFLLSIVINLVKRSQLVPSHFQYIFQKVSLHWICKALNYTKSQPNQINSKLSFNEIELHSVFYTQLHTRKCSLLIDTRKT